MCTNFQSKWSTFNFSAEIWGPIYVQYFDSNIVEGIAESWVEVEMSWVEVDELGGAGLRWVEVGARLSNTLYLQLFQ